MSSPIKKIIRRQAEVLNLTEKQKEKLTRLYEQKKGGVKTTMLQQFDKKVFTK